MTLQIRSVCADDFEAWLALWRQYLRFYAADLPHETTMRTWARFLDAQEPMQGLLANVDGQVVGLAHVIEQCSCWSRSNALYLQDLFVSPEARRLGVARALLVQVYAEAQTRSCDRVHWLTHQSNTAAMALYDQVAARTGFVQYASSVAAVSSTTIDTLLS